MASWVVLGIVNLAGLILTIINIFQCRPINASFSDITGEPKCIPLLTEFICSAPINIVTDLAILALPIPVLTSMRLPTRQKTILVFTFTLGIFVTIVDVVRIYYLQQAITNVPSSPSSDPGAIFGDSVEFPWNASLSLMWSAVEVNIGMTCACIPTLKPLIIKILPAMLVDPHGTRTAGSSTQDKEMANESPSKHGSDEGRQAQGAVPEAPTNGLRAPPAQDSGPEGVTMMDFLTTPDMTELPGQRNSTGLRIPQSATIDTLASNSTRRNSVYFGFVNMKRPKSMIKTDVAESFRYCLIVTILFLLWGFSYGLLNTLNNVVATISNMTTAQTLGLTSVYFGGGYFFGPLVVGEWVLRHDEHARFHDSKSRANSEPVGGFKATFIMGLAIYGIGTIMFWPSAVMTSFAGFMISNFVVGFGLGVLETGANPFIVLCGPPQYAEMRLCISQGFQGVATVISGLLAQKVFFVDLDSDDASGSMILLDVQWTYLAITLFCVALALFFYYMPLPEVTDEELGRAATRLPVDPQKRGIGGLQLRTWCIILAVLAQWVYVAAQEIMSIYFHSMITALSPDASSSADKPPGLTLSVSNYLLIAHAAFAISRFNAAHLAYAAVKHPNNRWIPCPRTILTLTSASSVLLALICVVLRPRANPDILAIPVILFFFAEGPVWPLVFAIGLRGQGKRTKRAGAWLTMGASGPAFWPFVMYGIINEGGSVQTAFVLVVVLLIFSLFYPLYLTFVKDARTLVDPIHKGRLVGVGAGGGMGGGENPSTAQSPSASHLDLDAIIRERQRNLSDSSTGKEGFLRRVSKSFPTRRRDTARTMSSSSPEYEHAEGNLRGDEPTIPEEELRAL